MERKKAHQRAPRTCIHCGTGFVAEYGDKRRVYCSMACVKTGATHADRAKRHGGTVEPVDPLLVFRRDRWTCQLCGRKAPERLRGKSHPRRPELDHIIPLRAGGDHTYKNCQCACRACNLKKKARPLGQMRLV